MTWQAVRYCWGHAEDAERPLPTFGRPCIDVSGQEGQISTAVTRCNLPLVGSWDDQNGDKTFRYEFPSGCRQAPDSDQEGIVLWMSLGTDRVTVDVRLWPELPSYRSSADLCTGVALTGPDGTVWPQPVLVAAPAVLKALGQYVEFISDLYDQPEPSAPGWDGRARDVAVCSVARLAARWKKVATLDAPPSALIVRIARRLPPILELICGKPRRVLRRERVLTPVSQIQELDVACLRWISRQPGRTFAEKAGHKQQLQSVRRFEDADILENRVVRDFLVRCVAAARRYETQNERFLRCDGSNAVKLVRTYRMRCQQLLQESPIGVVKPLASLPQPNYVLQHEPSYHTIWTYYQRLLRQQRQEEELWRWRQQTWSEICYLGITVMLQELCPRSPAMWTDYVVRDEPHAGRFLNQPDHPRSLPGDWWLDRQGKRDRDIIQLRPFVPSRELTGSSLGVSGLDALCPDFIIVRRRPADGFRSVRIVPCWTLFPDISRNDFVPSLTNDLLQSLSACRTESRLSGCILWATDDHVCSLEPTQGTNSVSATVARVPRDLWTATDSLRHLIQMLLADHDSP